jgi:hypothetical protein
MKTLLEERTTAGVHEKFKNTTVRENLHVELAAVSRYPVVYNAPSLIVANRAYIIAIRIAANTRQYWLMDARWNSNFGRAATISI